MAGADSVSNLGLRWRCRFYEHRAVLIGLCTDMIHQRKALIAKEGPSYFADKEARGDYLDFLDICLQATNEDGTEISTEDTAAISFTLYCLAKDKKYQDLCAEEAKEVSLQDPTPDLATLKKLKYITMCFKEATRLYPPVCISISTIAGECRIATPCPFLQL
jgi:hypothetical protein